MRWGLVERPDARSPGDSWGKERNQATESPMDPCENVGFEPQLKMSGMKTHTNENSGIHQ